MRTRERIASMLKERVLMLDGSYGAEFIRKKGEDPGVPDLLNLTDPDLVLEVHSGYVRAGADILLTNTFGATPVKLKSSGIEDQERIVRDAVKLARKAAGSETIVLGDIGPTGLLPYPLGEGTFDLFYDNFSRTASIMIDEGVDGIILETFSDIQELKAAVLAVRGISEEVFLTAMMTFDRSGRTLTGTDPRNFAVTMGDLEVDALGINCSLGPEEMIPVFQELAAHSNKPLFVEPNAGLPIMSGEGTIYPVGPEEFSKYCETFLEAGANVVGGCCGTHWGHISVLRRTIGDRPPAERETRKISAVTSPLNMITFDDFVVIGERVNPAGRKRLREAMEGGDLDLVMEEAGKQAASGARVLDVNFGHESSIPLDLMERAVLRIAYELGTPVSLDVQTVEVLERLMRIYPGRPLVNSSSVEEGDLEKKLDLIRRYGGMLIVLAMGREVPRSGKDRIGAVEGALLSIVRKGIEPERIVFDPIVLSLGAGNDPRDTLEALGWMTAEGLLSVCGLSNLSFGLPDRTFYNASFLSMAVERGLSSAIMNPLDETLSGMLRSSLVVAGRGELPKADVGVEDEFVRCLLEGKEKDAFSITGKLLKEKDALRVLEEDLKPAMETVGSLYSRGKVFLPQLILAAQTSRSCFEEVEKRLPKGAGKETFVIATVQGDIHDIGKNIAAAVIRSSGYDVIDLGKDVPAAKILEEVRNRRPVALGLSAMMTTTAGRIGEIVKGLRDEGLDVRVIAGGASLNDKVVAEMGADLYADDVVKAVNFLKQLSVDARGRNLKS